MKKAMTVSEMMDQYLETGTVLAETGMKGDYRRGNKIAIKNREIFNMLKQDNVIGKQVLQLVMSSNCEKARSIAAADALRLGILIEQASAILEEISSRDDMIGFEARMSLKIWRGEVPGKTL